MHVWNENESKPNPSNVIIIIPELFSGCMRPAVFFFYVRFVLTDVYNFKGGNNYYIEGDVRAEGMNIQPP